MQWSPDGSTLAFVSTSRDHKSRAPPRGRCRHRRRARRLRGERSPTQFESRTARRTGGACRRRTRSSGTRERDNWGQLYLYDLDDRQAQEPDHDRRGQRHARSCTSTRRAARSGSSASAARRAGIRTSVTSTGSASTASGLTLLTPDDGDHDVSLSPAGRVLRRHLLAARHAAGESRCATATASSSLPLEKADISKLARRGLEAADPDHGEGARRQDRPLRPDVPADQVRSGEEVSDHQPHLSGPADAAASAAARFAAARGDTQALAELGFIVVEIDGMGTPWRSKEFHDAYYGNMGDNTLPDQVAGMKQLAQQYPVHRHRPRRHLRPLGRRIRHGRRDVPLSRISSRSASRSRATTTTASTKTTGASASRGCSTKKPDGTSNYDDRGEPEHREEPEGPAAAGARHDGQQRAAVQHAARGGRADQGEQGLRPAPASRTAATATAMSTT